MNLGITNNEGNGSTGWPYLNYLKGNQGWVIGNNNHCGTATGTLGTNPLTTTSGSSSVQVTQTAHGLMAGVNNVYLSGATAFNNVTLNGTFTVQSVVDANNYTVTAATTANANGTGGGSAVVFVDLINNQNWSKMQVDGNGYPTTMALTGVVGPDCTAASFAASEFAFVAAFGGSTLPTGEPAVQRGTYVLLYNGVGTISVTNDCSIVESGGTGRDIYNCNEFGGSMTVHVTAINGATPIKDYALIYSPGSTGVSGGNTVGANEALYHNGPALTGGIEIFSPQWIARVKPFPALRFMDAFQTNFNGMINWSDRVPVGCYSYSVACPPSSVGAGLPFEAAIALCNEVKADCWLNNPVGFTSSAATSFATLAHNNLNAPLRAIVESGNEYWNANDGGGFNSVTFGIVASQEATCGTGSILNQGIVNSIVVNDAWLNVWGSDAPSRLVRVLGGQAGFQSQNQFAMAYTLTTGPCAFMGNAASHATHFATAPYWDVVEEGYPVAWINDPDQYLKFFEQANGSPLVIPTTTAPGCTSGGTSTAYTVSSNTGNCGVNGSIPATPANGAFVVVNFNQAATFTQFTASITGTAMNVSAITNGTLIPNEGIGPSNAAGCPEAGKPCVYTRIDHQVNGTPGGVGNYVVTVAVNYSSQTFVGIGATLVADGGNAYLMTQGNGETWGPDGTFQLWASTGFPTRQIFCFTVANIDGVATPTWRSAFGDAGDVGTWPYGASFYSTNYSDAMNAGLGLIGYESGTAYVAQNSTTRATWFAGAARDARMGVAELAYRNQLKTNGHGALTMQFNHIGPFTGFGDWSYMEGLLAPGSPRFNSAQNFK